MDFEQKEILIRVGKRITEFRNIRSMSQEKLALIAGLHSSNLGRIERGMTSPNITTLLKISMGLKISLAQLLDFEIGTNPTNKEAIFRVTQVLSKLTGDDAIKIASIVESVAEVSESIAKQREHDDSYSLM